MQAATGMYRLDAPSADAFGASSVRLVQRGNFVVGRFGRLGSLRGVIDGPVLNATWSKHSTEGWMRLVFDPSYRTFDGTFGVKHGPVGRCSGSKAARRSADLGD